MPDTNQLVGLTLAAVLTGPGIVPAALLVRQLVEYLQFSLVFFANINARILVFAITAVLYVVAWWAAGVHDLEGAFAAFLVWLACGMATMAAHQLLSEANIGTQPKATEK